MKKNMRYIAFVCMILSVPAIGIIFPSLSDSEELRTDPVMVTLTGTPSKASFENDAYKRHEQVYVLKLAAPIDVAGDDLGDPVKNVKKIQMVFSGNTIKPETFSNKEVRVTGSLFHAHTAHHFTDVLIQVKEIALSRKK